MYQEFVLNVEGSYHSNASISVALVSTVDVLCVESVNIRCKIHQREVDEFHGEDEGLIIAEIELPSEDTQFDKPQWLGKEVTQDTTYYNSTLSKTSWKAIQKSYAEAKAWDDWRDSLVKK